MQRENLEFFDPMAEWHVVERALPHWSQPGVVTFITWRLADSLPRSVLFRLEREIASMIHGAGLNPRLDLKEQLKWLPSTKRTELQWQLFVTRDKYLDQGFGACELAVPQHSATVMKSLQHFDEQRYFLTDAVVMPNHAHFLCAFASDVQMLKQCTSWKRFSGREINQLSARAGEFWQVDQFDHLVRSPEEFERYRSYIAENPAKTGLKSGQFRHFQKSL